MNLSSKKMLKIPPPIVTCMFALLMFGFSRWVPFEYKLIYADWVTIVLLLFAVMLLLPAVVQFYQHKTTVNPLRPETTKSLVVSGLYRYTRNPMYLGMGACLLAWLIYLANPLNIVFLWGFVVYMNRFQIKPEEQALEMLFGDDYIHYKAKVRRWL